MSRDSSNRGSQDAARRPASSPARLRREQYRDASYLDARIALHALCSVNQQGWTPWLFDQIDALGLAPGAEILELGCGPATLWRDNAERIPPGWRIHLSDFSPGMIADAKGRLSGLGREFGFEVFNAEAIPKAAGSLDAVFANHMLYHVPDRQRAFREIARVLRPGGVLVASTLSRDTMKEIETLVRACTDRSDFEFNRSVKAFALDDGREQLSRFFGSIEERHYVDALEIRDTPPLLGYLQSIIVEQPLTENELAAIDQATRAEIEQNGAFHVNKNTGVFLATSPNAESHP